MRVRNSDLANFGTKHQRETDLAQYAERRPHKINEKTLEKTQNHKKDLLGKNLGSKKNKWSRKQADDVSAIFS